MFRSSLWTVTTDFVTLSLLIAFPVIALWPPSVLGSRMAPDLSAKNSGTAGPEADPPVPAETLPRRLLRPRTDPAGAPPRLPRSTRQVRGTPEELVGWALGMHGAAHVSYQHWILNHTAEIDGNTATPPMPKSISRSFA
jgi:hypothetical protein